MDLLHSGHSVTREQRSSGTAVLVPGRLRTDDVAIWHGAVLRTGALACFPGEGGLASESPESHGRGPAHR